MNDKGIKIHNFLDEDLRILASLAIDQHTDHLFFKVFKTVNVEDNYWSFDCRFTHSEDFFETYYDSLYIDCGNRNEPETYQMAWTTKKNEFFNTRPITSPLVVVHQFEEMCKKSNVQLN